MPHTKTCFVGENPPVLSQERPGKWYACRYACDEHKSRAILKSSENLYVFLERRQDRSFPLEGNGLNYLINPVQINGQAGWCDFHFSSPAICEEVFPCESYFDFYLQHAEHIQPFFFAFCQEYRKAGCKKASVNETLLAVCRTDAMASNYFSQLLQMWNLQHTLQHQLGGQGLSWVNSPDHALETFLAARELLNKEIFRTDAVDKMFTRLIQLGEQRFAHLTGR